MAMLLYTLCTTQEEIDAALERGVLARVNLRGIWHAERAGVLVVYVEGAVAVAWSDELEGALDKWDVGLWDRLRAFGAHDEIGMRRFLWHSCSFCNYFGSCENCPLSEKHCASVWEDMLRMPSSAIAGMVRAYVTEDRGAFERERFVGAMRAAWEMAMTKKKCEMHDRTEKKTEGGA